MSTPKIFNEHTLREEIIKVWGPAGAHIEVFDRMYKTLGLNPDSVLKPHVVYENNIDLRKVNCGCGNPQCKIGLNYDTNAEGKAFLLLTDKYGNEHSMHLNSSIENEIMDLIL